MFKQLVDNGKVCGKAGEAYGVTVGMVACMTPPDDSVGAGVEGDA